MMKPISPALFPFYRATVCCLFMICACATTAIGANPEMEQKIAEVEKEAALAAEAAKKKAVAEAKKIARKRLAVANPALEQQFLQQFRPILRSELEFIREVCDLSAEQRPKIKAAGEASLKEVATLFATRQGEGQRIRLAGPGGSKTSSDPREVIHQGLIAALRESLTAEQMAQYSDEVTKLTASRKRAAILHFVSRLDGTLSLTQKQREKITESISSKWQDKWEEWLNTNNYNDIYFPSVPNSCIVPHLDSNQALVWNGLQKVEFGINYNWDGRAEEKDDWWDGK